MTERMEQEETYIHSADLSLIAPYTSMINPQDSAKHFREYVGNCMREATLLVKSTIRCTCGDNHYMAWPAVRNTNSDGYTKLTTLPFCPRRILLYARKIGNHDRIMKELEYERG